jgi:hypothetical protein
MRKILGIIVLSLLLSGNPYADETSSMDVFETIKKKVNKKSSKIKTKNTEF